MISTPQVSGNLKAQKIQDALLDTAAFKVSMSLCVLLDTITYLICRYCVRSSYFGGFSSETISSLIS